MTIHLKRLDFTNTVSAMLCLAARHAVTADGARQQALDEIQRSLNNIAAIIALHDLADQLNGPVPPVPPRHAPDDDIETDDDLALTVTPDEEPDAESESTPTHPRPLNPAPTLVLRYIHTHPGCGTTEICDALSISNPTLSHHVKTIRQAGHPLLADGRPARYTLAQAGETDLAATSRERRHLFAALGSQPPNTDNA